MMSFPVLLNFNVKGLALLSHHMHTAFFTCPPTLDLQVFIFTLLNGVYINIIL